MKKFYFEPAIEITKFDIENVLTASGSITNNGDATLTENELPVDAVAQSVSWNNIKITF